MSLSSYSPLLDLAVTLLLSAVATLLGTRIRVALALPATKGLIDLSIAFALGAGALSFLTLGIGLLWWIQPATVWALLAASSVVGLPAWAVLRGTAVRALDELRFIWQSLGRLAWLLVGLCVMAALNLLGSLAPVTYSDTLNHYMALARFVVRQGGLSFEPYKWWNMPAAVEMLFVDALAIFPGAVGAPIEWVFGLATVLVLLGLGLHLAGPLGAVFAALLYYSIPFVIQESTIAKNDLALALFALLGLAALVFYRQSGQQRWVIASGLLAGLAMATKLYGLLVAGALGMALLLSAGGPSRAALGPLARSAVVFGLCALALGAPWYLKAWLQGGDPIWPFGYPLFESRQWDMASYLKFANYELGVGDDPLSFLLGPWSLTTNLAAFMGERVPAVVPAFLGLLPGLVLVWSRLGRPARSASLLALLSAAAYYAVWFKLYQQPGYLLSALVMLVPPTAVVAVALISLSRPMAVAVWGAVLSVALFGLVVNIGYNAQFARVVLGLQRPAEFVADNVFYYADIVHANTALPPGSKVLVFPTTDFYFEVPHVNGLPGFQGYVEYLSLETETDLLRRLDQLGVTHVFQDERYFSSGADFVRFWLGGQDRLREQFQSLVERGVLVPVYRNDDAVIVASRTLGQKERGTVVIYRIDYSAAVGREQAPSASQTSAPCGALPAVCLPPAHG